MTLDDYERHLIGQLGWACHTATRPRAALPRPCPTCRAKWSYRRRTRWELLKAFCRTARAPTTPPASSAATTTPPPPPLAGGRRPRGQRRRSRTRRPGGLGGDRRWGCWPVAGAGGADPV